MSYKTILAILDTRDNSAAVADFAFAIAADSGAHVIGLHAENISAVPLVAPMEIPDPVAVQALQDMAHSETTAVEGIFRAIAQAAGASSEWRSFATSTGYGSAPLIDSARSADLLIASQADPANPSDSHVDLDSFLFEAGRPVLMIPYIIRQPKPIKRVLIAWNGSKEAARATFDALPFLKAAEAVEIFSVDPAADGAAFIDDHRCRDRRDTGPPRREDDAFDGPKRGQKHLACHRKPAFGRQHRPPGHGRACAFMAVADDLRRHDEELVAIDDGADAVVAMTACRKDRRSCLLPANPANCSDR